MSENIWQVDMFSDLVGFLKNTSTDYIVLSLVLKNTQQEIRSDIKKFIKRKAKEFPNVMFLFYTVQQQDVGKISFIKGNFDSYPMMCHIKTSSNEVMTYLEGIDGIEPMEECWDIVERHYVANLKNSKNKGQRVSEQSGQSSGQGSMNGQNFAQNTINNLQTNPMQNKMNQQLTQQMNEMAERRKIVKKLTYLKEKAEEYTLEFMEDCRLRKKEEEKIKKKQQSATK